MLITTITFDFVIPPNYFPGYRILTPFTASIRYEANEVQGVTGIIWVGMSPACLAIVNNNSQLINDMEAAARNNWESMQADETEPQDFTDDLYRVMGNLNATPYLPFCQPNHQ